jgi:esterase
MLVRGSNSNVVIPKDEAEFLRRQPGTRVEVVAGADHSVQSDWPVRLAELITDFTGTVG